MARARKGGDPGAKRFQASLANLRRTRKTADEAAPVPEAAAVETDEVKAEWPKRSQAKTKLR